MAAVPEAAVPMTRDRGAAMGRHGRGFSAMVPLTLLPAQGRGTQHSLWKSSWQMLATAWAVGGPHRGLGMRWWWYSRVLWSPESLFSSGGSWTPQRAHSGSAHWAQRPCP